MKKLTLLALTLGLTFGAFAQNFNLTKQLPLNITKGETPANVKVKNSVAVKGTAVNFSDVVCTENDMHLFDATFKITPNEGWKFVIASLGLKGGFEKELDGYIQQGIAADRIGVVKALIVALEQQPQFKWEEAAGEQTQQGFWGNKEWEIAVLAVNGADTTYEIGTFTTKSSSLSGTPTVSNFTVDAKTEVLNFDFDMNDQNVIICGYVTYQANVDAIKQQASQAGYNFSDADAAEYDMQRAKATSICMYAPNEAVDKMNANFKDGWLYDNAQTPKTWETGDELFAMVYGANGNGDWSETATLSFKVGTVGLANEAQVASVSVYPNPTTDYVKVASAEAINNVEMVNTLGQVVYSNNNVANTLNIPVANMDKGVYFVKVMTNNGVKTDKVIVK